MEDIPGEQIAQGMVLFVDCEGASIGNFCISLVGNSTQEKNTDKRR